MRNMNLAIKEERYNDAGNKKKDIISSKKEEEGYNLLTKKEDGRICIYYY